MFKYKCTFFFFQFLFIVLRTSYQTCAKRHGLQPVYKLNKSVTQVLLLALKSVLSLIYSLCLMI